MDQRPDPDQLLKRVQAEESRRGKLKLFFGASPGVGKTYSMLEAAQKRKKEGVDVVIGVVETHGRAETAALLQGLEVLPRKKMEYKGVFLDEFDLDAALARKPQLLLVDELAHTNAPGSRHSKRWQDVQELLDAGINVYTTLNVQHWESLNDVVAQITGVVVRETVPDTFLEQTHDISLVDISPEDLLQRLKEGRVYLGPLAERALEHFFKPANLTALRELALRHTAERVDLQVQAIKADTAVKNVWPVTERLLVGVTTNPMAARIVRAAHRLSSRLRCEWIAVHVETPETTVLDAKERSRLLETLRLAEELGAETATLTGENIAETLVEFARGRNVSKIIVGKPRRPLWRERLLGSVVNEIAHRCGDIDLYVISGVGGEFKFRRSLRDKKAIPWQWWLWAVLTAAGSTLVCWPLFPRLDHANLIMVYLLGVMGVSYRFGRGPGLLTACLSVLFFDFFFVRPYMAVGLSDTQYLITFAVMLLAGFLISTITGRLRLQNEAAREREARTRALYRLSRVLSETPDSREVAVKAWQHMEEFYRTPVLLLEPDDAGKLTAAAGSASKFEFDEKEEAVAKWVFDRGQEAGAGTNTLTASKGLYLPLKGPQGAVGVLAVRPTEEISGEDPEAMQLLETFASEIGAALASTQLSEAAGRSVAQMEAERLRNLLLSSFSIDIHEPLAEISRVTRHLLDIGASSLHDAARRGLQEIQDKSSHLISIAKELPKLIESRTKESSALSAGKTAAESLPQERPAPPSASAPGKIRVSTYLDGKTIHIFKGPKTEEQVLKELIDSLSVSNPAEALSLILEREKAGSTIIGSGLSIPHARIPGLKSIKAALGIVPKGIKSSSVGEKSIQLVMLFLSPADNFREHLSFLAAVSGLFRNEGLAQNLVRAAKPEDVLREIRATEVT